MFLSIVALLVAISGFLAAVALFIYGIQTWWPSFILALAILAFWFFLWRWLYQRNEAKIAAFNAQIQATANQRIEEIVREHQSNEEMIFNGLKNNRPDSLA